MNIDSAQARALSSGLENVRKESLWLAPYEWIAAWFTMGLGIWTMYCHLFVVFGRSFDDLVTWSVVPALGFLGLAYVLSPSIRSVDAILSTSDGAASHGRGFQIVMAVSACGVALAWWWGMHTLFWLIASAGLFCCWWLSVHNDRPAYHREMRLTYSKRGDIILSLTVALAALFATAITLMSHRPDIDDAFFVNIIASVLSDPHLPLLRSDGMLGITNLPLLRGVYKVQSFELLSALLTRVSGVSHFTTYYLILPALIAPLTAIASWLLGRLFFGWRAAIAMIVTIGIMVAWGDAHRVYGNLAFVRLFQGKAVLVSVGLPLTVYYALRYAVVPSRGNWALLCLSQIAVVGVSNSGLVIAPVAAGLALFGAWNWRRSGAPSFVTGMAALAYPIMTLLLIQLQTVLAPMSVNLADSSSLGSLRTVLGETIRGSLVLLALVLCPLLVERRRQVIAGYALAITLLLLGPWVSGLAAAALSSNFSWRIYWAVPFPLLFGLAVAGLTTLRPAALGYGGAALLVMLFAVSGYWTVSSQNATEIAAPRPKVSATYAVASAAIALTPARGSILAHHDVSVWVTTFIDHPYPFVVRDYVRLLEPFIGPGEVASRYRLQSFVDNAAPLDVGWAGSEIARRQFDTVVVRSPGLNAAGFTDLLTSQGYQRVQVVADFEIWVRHSAAIQGKHRAS